MRKLIGHILSLALALAFLLIAAPALAAGTVKITNGSPKEEDGRWLLKFEINYGKTPDLAHIPMQFSFKPTMLYERALTDQSPDTPVLNRLALHNQPSIDLDMDVGFGGASGEIFKVTKFSMKLARTNQFEAGEYELTITDKRANSKVGGVMKVVLQGDNPVINRKSIIFHADSPTKKKESKPEGAVAADNTKGGTAAEDMGPDLSDVGDEDGKPDEAPPPVQPSQKSGGCSLGGAPASGLAGLLLVALALGLARRRRLCY